MKQQAGSRKLGRQVEIRIPKGVGDQRRFSFAMGLIQDAGARAASSRETSSIVASGQETCTV